MKLHPIEAETIRRLQNLEVDFNPYVGASFFSLEELQSRELEAVDIGEEDE